MGKSHTSSLHAAAYNLPGSKKVMLYCCACRQTNYKLGQKLVLHYSSANITAYGEEEYGVDQRGVRLSPAAGRRQSISWWEGAITHANWRERARASNPRLTRTPIKCSLVRVINWSATAAGVRNRRRHVCTPQTLALSITVSRLQSRLHPVKCWLISSLSLVRFDSEEGPTFSHVNSLLLISGSCQNRVMGLV